MSRPARFPPPAIGSPEALRPGRNLLLLLCAVLSLGPAVACRKKAAGGAIGNPPLVSPAPVQVEVEPVEDPPVETVTLVEVPTPPATPWMEADESFRRRDLSLACSLYHRIREEPASQPLPTDVAVRAILACSVGEPEQRRLARNWLDELNAGPPPGEDQVTLLVISRLLEELQATGQAVAERDARLERINEELEKLKKIDSRRRRP